jgi:F-type H+-transporting ATPase subunit epsilon
MAKLSIRVVTPEREVFVGDADMVVARTTSGDVGILPGHVPMLVPLAIGVLAIVEGSTRTQAAVDGGFLHVRGSSESTRVDILAEHAELASEIDVTHADQRRAAAERRLSEEQNGEARAELAKAIARTRITGS